MALEEKVRPYEILIRLDSSGVAGAQYQEISEIFRDGTLISASVGEPKPLDANKAISEKVLGQALAAALGENASLKARISELESSAQAEESGSNDAS